MWQKAPISGEQGKARLAYLHHPKRPDEGERTQAQQGETLKKGTEHWHGPSQPDKPPLAREPDAVPEQQAEGNDGKGIKYPAHTTASFLLLILCSDFTKNSSSFRMKGIILREAPDVT